MSFDEVLELLHLGGRSLPHAVLMMIPEAWEKHAEMDDARRAFYEFHASVMEPWDGPACVTFTDGTLIGAVLDRNGLRPARYWVTDTGLVVLASEVGVLDLDPATIVRKGRLQPGRMFLVDTAAGRIVDDAEIKSQLAAEHPYDDWLHAGLLKLPNLPDREHIVYSHESVLRRQQTFGYTEEELRILLAPMARAGAEPIGSMGNDSPLAALVGPAAPAVRLLQPAVRAGHQPAARRDPRRARDVAVGGDRPRAEPARARADFVPADRRAVPGHRQRRAGQDPARQRRRRPPGLAPFRVRGLYAVDGGGAALEQRLAEICAETSAAIDAGARIIVLSDRDSDRERAPIPSLLLTAAVHHHLIQREDPHQGRPDRRSRRRARGAPRRAAHRLRRRCRQPLPGDGNRRGHDPHRCDHSASPATSPCTTW